jgi:hypothetical protein
MKIPFDKEIVEYIIIFAVVVIIALVLLGVLGKF